MSDAPPLEERRKERDHRRNRVGAMEPVTFLADQAVLARIFATSQRRSVRYRKYDPRLHEGCLARQNEWLEVRVESPFRAPAMRS